MMQRRFLLPGIITVVLAALVSFTACAPQSQVDNTVIPDAIAAIDQEASIVKAQQEAEEKAAKEAAAKKEADEILAQEKAAREKAAQEAEEKAAKEAEAKAAEEEAARLAQEEARQAEEAQRAQQETQASAISGSAADIYASLDVVQDYRASFIHGSKPASVQRYIMLHDTEGESSPESIVNYWDGTGTGVAAHFVVGRDGHVVQCVALDNITHHAGFGNTGNNALYGVEDESRDDKVGTVPIGDWASDYGMNSYSIGIEMVHVGGGSPYTEEQLAAVDKVIAYIDAYYGFPSTIIDHKAWRSGNSDTSPEFAPYLANYQATRHH